MKQYPQINFAHLITQYTRDFRTGSVEAATDYFTLICLNADLPGSLGKSQSSVCHEALREFILETRDFAKLLGDIRGDGARVKGIIEERLDLINLADQDDFLKNITIQAASVAEDKGLLIDAVLLYHLAENYDRVIDIINRALSDAIAVELGGVMPKLQPLRPRVEQGQEAAAIGTSLSLTAVDDPVVLGKNMIMIYNEKPMYYEKIRASNRDACILLLRMVEAKMQVEAERWTPALDVSFYVFSSSLYLQALTNSYSAPRPLINLVFFHCRLRAQCHTFAMQPRPSLLSQTSFPVTLVMSLCGVLHVLATSAGARSQVRTRPTCTKDSQRDFWGWPRI